MGMRSSRRPSFDLVYCNVKSQTNEGERDFLGGGTGNKHASNVRADPPPSFSSSRKHIRLGAIRRTIANKSSLPISDGICRNINCRYYSTAK